MFESIHLLATARALDISVLLGRAGGGTGGGSSGGSFSGGGSSGGSFFGGSGGGFGGGAGLAVLFFGGFGAWVIFMIIRMLIRRSQGGGSSSSVGSTLPTGMAPAAMGETFGGGETARASTAVELTAGIDEIKAHDPAFDPDALITGLQASFYVVQQGWSERRPDLTRSVMADGIWNAHRMQIDGYTRSKQTNLMDGLAIQYANLVAASCDGHHDSVVVRFFVESADYVVSDENGKVVRGHKNMEPWCEDWIYQRSAQAKTNPEGGLLQRKCPNCGAPLDVEDTGACKYCRAPIMGGDQDWVLVRIDQLPSWEWAMANIPR